MLDEFTSQMLVEPTESMYGEWALVGWDLDELAYLFENPLNIASQNEELLDTCFGSETASRPCCDAELDNNPNPL